MTLTSHNQCLLRSTSRLCDEKPRHTRAKAFSLVTLSDIETFPISAQSKMIEGISIILRSSTPLWRVSHNRAQVLESAACRRHV
jgi:hypothetical protein